MPYTYRKSERLRKNREFVAAMKGKRLSVDGLSLFYAGNGGGDYRVGISVGKKLAKAATRNKLRRRLRDCISRTLKGSAAGYDLVFVARQALIGLEHDRLRSIVETAIKKSGILNLDPAGIKQ